MQACLADDRARADYLNQKPIIGQVVCADSCIVAIFYEMYTDDVHVSCLAFPVLLPLLLCYMKE